MGYKLDNQAAREDFCSVSSCVARNKSEWLGDSQTLKRAAQQMSAVLTQQCSVTLLVPTASSQCACGFCQSLPGNSILPPLWVTEVASPCLALLVSPAQPSLNGPSPGQKLALPLISCTLGKVDLVSQLGSPAQLTLVTGKRASWPEGMNVGVLTPPATCLS